MTDTIFPASPCLQSVNTENFIILFLTQNKTTELAQYIDNVFRQLNALVIKTIKYSKLFDKKPRHVSAYQ
jgi:hypothetical protein